MKNKQSGNVLFLILIAIALLGALTVLMTRTGSQSDDTGDTEQSSIQISNLLKYAAGIQSTVNNLLTQGCSENDISFDADLTTTGGYENTNNTTNFSCFVFHPQGGGLTWKTFSNPAGTAVITVNKIRSWDNTKTIGTAEPELVFLYSFSTNGDALCRRVNAQLSNPYPIFEAGGSHNQIKFTGTYADPSTGGITSNSQGSTTLAPATGCFCDSGDPTCATASNHWFYHTLLKR